MDCVGLALIVVERKAHVNPFGVGFGVVCRTFVEQGHEGGGTAVFIMLHLIFAEAKAMLVLVCGLIADVGVQVTLTPPMAQEFYLVCWMFVCRVGWSWNSGEDALNVIDIDFFAPFVIYVGAGNLISIAVSFSLYSKLYNFLNISVKCF